ncbi:hypothetical protein VPH35_063119 [Triticum aestivum]
MLYLPRTEREEPSSGSRGGGLCWPPAAGPRPPPWSGKSCRPPATCSLLSVCSGPKRHVQPGSRKTAISGTWA